MATERQIEANRRNAQKSTGPRTAEGKERSRRNAMKHGLAALELLPEQDEGAVRVRVEKWAPTLRPGDDWGWRMLERVAIEAVRVERCFREESAARAMVARRAEGCWDDDRRLAAEELGKRLTKDPASVKLRLEATPQGCAWLVARWEGLLAAGSGEGGWTPERVGRALDLLGAPADDRHAPPADPAATALAEIGRLGRRVDEFLDDLDDAERDLAECGLGPEAEKAVRRIRRYEAACLRRLEWARKQLGVAAAGRAADAPPLPSPRPGPLVEPGAASGSAADRAPNGADPTPDHMPAPTEADPTPRPAAGPASKEADRDGGGIGGHAPDGADPAPSAAPSGAGASAAAGGWKAGPESATLARSLRSVVVGRPPAPNRRARRAALARAA